MDMLIALGCVGIAMVALFGSEWWIGYTPPQPQPIDQDDEDDDDDLRRREIIQMQDCI